MARRNPRAARGEHARRARSARQPRFPVAYVKYHDHCWIKSDEVASIQDAAPFEVEETGFLLHETEKFVTLAKERSTDGEKGKTTYDDVTIIMRSDILDIRVFPLDAPDAASTPRPEPMRGRAPERPPPWPRTSSASRQAAKSATSSRNGSSASRRS